MHGESLVSYQVLFGFLLALARVGAVFAFLPLAAFRAGPDVARIVLAVATTLLLRSEWNAPAGTENSLAGIVAGVAGEAAVGLTIGISLSLALEVFAFAAQEISLMAGFAYASTIDPASGADSTVLITVAQLFSALLFFATGADRLIIRVIADSFRHIPPGEQFLSLGLANGVTRFAATLFPAGLRLAGPIIGVILIADLSLAVLSRLQSQLQLTSITMPVKTGVAILLLALTITTQARMFPSQIAGWTTLASAMLQMRR